MNKYNKHLIIVGTARSGTSWLSETIAQQHRYRMLFEPEHEFRTKKGSLICDQWITKPTDSPEAHTYLKQVFANRVDCDWIGQSSNRRYKRHLWPLIPKRYIIKFVRANLSAVYMNAHFGIPVVHMLRNPYDVLHSQQQVEFPWLYNLEHFKNNPCLVALIKKSFNFDICKTNHLLPLQILTLRWCIENVIPLKVQKPITRNYHIIHYESLLGEIELFYELCQKLNLKPIEDLELHYRKPSSKTHPRSKVFSKANIDNKFTFEEYKHINLILDSFETDFYPKNN